MMRINFVLGVLNISSMKGLGKNEVRLAYVLKKEDLANALIVLSKALESYPGRTI